MLVIKTKHFFKLTKFFCRVKENSHPNAHHSQIIGGDTVKLLGGFIPPPPGFGTPARTDYHSSKRIKARVDHL